MDRASGELGLAETDWATGEQRVGKEYLAPGELSTPILAAEKNRAPGELARAKADRTGGKFRIAEVHLTAEELGVEEVDRTAGELGAAEVNLAAGEPGARRPGPLKAGGRAPVPARGAALDLNTAQFGRAGRGAVVLRGASS